MLARMSDYTGQLTYYRWRSCIHRWGYPDAWCWPREARFYEGLGRFYLMDRALRGASL